MGVVHFDISMSLDGFITAPNDDPDEPLGVGGQRLHAWLFNDETGHERELLAKSMGLTKAVIAGRRTYDNSCKWWGKGNGPAGETPVFIVSHKDTPKEAMAEGAPFTFVSDGIEGALEKARTVADDGDICVMGGANVIQQYLRAGLIDEVRIHLVPVLLGGGIRLFDKLGAEQIELERISVVESPEVTHLRFRVVK